MALSTRPTSQQEVGVTRARQGRLGRPVLWVLLCSLALVVIGFAAAWGWKANDLSNTPTKGGTVHNPALAQSFNAPEPAPINPQPYQKGTDPSTNHTHP